MTTALHRSAAGLAGALLALLVALPTLAHAELVSSKPEDGALLTAPPASVELRFSEGLDARKSSFRLVGPDGEVGSGRPTRDGDRVMALDGLSLAPGEYTVRWTIGSADGHVERGTIRFTVAAPTPAQPTASPRPTASPSEAASATATDAPPTAAPVGATPTTVGPASPAAASAAAAGSATTNEGDARSASATDVAIPIVAGLVLVAGVGVFVLRRSRRA